MQEIDNRTATQLVLFSKVYKEIRFDSDLNQLRGYIWRQKKVESAGANAFSVDAGQRLGYGTFNLAIHSSVLPEILAITLQGFKNMG